MTTQKENIQIRLEHARLMYFQASNMRMKNFNFFLIIIIGIISAFSSKTPLNINIIISIFGFLLSILFFLLDKRGKILLLSAIGDLEIAEKELEISIIKPRTTGNSKLVSHTFVYRSVYVLTALLSLALPFKPLFS